VGTINLPLPLSGQNIAAALHASNYGLLQTLLNGNLDDANLNSISGAKITGLVVVLPTNVVSGANTDISWGGGNSVGVYLVISTGGGSLRRVGAPTKGSGVRLTVSNESAASATIIHNAGAGSGAPFSLRGGVDLALAVGEKIEFVYNGSSWNEVDRTTPVITGTPDGTKFLRDDFTWQAAAGGVQADRRNSTKDVVNTTTETDLLNGDIDIPANALGPNGIALLFAEGDWLNNSGATPTITLKVKLGATTIWAATSGAIPSSGAARGFWSACIAIQNAGATNSQLLVGSFSANQQGSSAASTGTGGWGSGNLIIAEAAMGGSAAEDTTSLKNLALTVTWSAANANNSIRNHRAILNVLKGV